MKNKQGFSTLVLIIILAALALGGEYAAWKNRSSTPIGGSPTSPDVDSFTTAPAPTTDLDTTGWKTYRDDSFGFEVEYPSDWDSTTYPPSNENYTTYLHDANYTGFRITAAKVSGTQTMEQMLANGDRMIGSQNPPSKKVLSTKKIQVAGLSAIQRVEESYAFGFTTIATYFIKDKIAYSLSLHKPNSSGRYTEKEQRIYGLILPTFRFTK